MTHFTSCILFLSFFTFIGCTQDNPKDQANQSNQSSQRDIFEVQKVVSGKFKINFIDDSSDYNLASYPLMNFGKEIDTLEVISELLSFRGDSRLCAIPRMSYSSLSSNIESGSYSIDLEALFLINQFFLGENYYSFSPCPRLKCSLTSMSDKEIIETAYDLYRNWFEEVKTIGLEKARSRQIYPLKNSEIFWGCGG